MSGAYVSTDNTSRQSTVNQQFGCRNKSPDKYLPDCTCGVTQILTGNYRVERA